MRLEVGVGGGVIPVPWAFNTYVDSVDSSEPAVKLNVLPFGEA